MSAEKQLSKYAEWTAPRAGMFLWLKLTQVDDSMDIFEELKAAKVVVVPGDPVHANRMRPAMSNTTMHTSPLLSSRPYSCHANG
jgi:DNA-binding transcriptional MocR family regulator